MKKYSKVIVTGSIAYDEIMDFPGFFADYFQPERLHQINVSFVVNQLERQLGGIAANIAYNLSLATTKKIIILGAVGKDGSRLLDFLNKRKIDTSGVIKDKRLYSSCGTVFTDKKDNQIWGYYYGAGILAKKIKLNNSVDQNNLLIIGANHWQACVNLQNQAIKQKIDYIYDPGPMITTVPVKNLIKGINHCRWLIGNDYEIANILKITKLSKNKLLDQGINIITTLGEQGVKYEEKVGKVHKVFDVEGYKVKKLVDPTGAGDAWRGGFVASIVNGKNLIDSLKFANALASFSLESYGTVNHRPSVKAIEKRASILKVVESSL